MNTTPEEACRAAIDAGLVVHRAHPLNCETPLPALMTGVAIPNAPFYVRNHFPIPAVDPATWHLQVGGLVERPMRLTLRDLEQLRSETQVVTLECAGNGRSLLRPPAAGEQWGLGAASTAQWTGVPLVEVLDRAGVLTGATSVIMRGADGGTVEDRSEKLRFERSLSLEEARSSGVLLAYAMSGEPLPIQHGRPLRAIVPGWYAVASVKWLTEIDVVDRPFIGYFQTERYVYEWEDDGRVEREPVTLQQVRAIITEPAAGGEVPAGDLTVRGAAWSGAAPIARVDVRVEGGPWREARLVGDRYPHGSQGWELRTVLDGPGETTVRARATDRAGRTQPEHPRWNRLGYGANAIHEVKVRVLRPAGS